MYVNRKSETIENKVLKFLGELIEADGELFWNSDDTRSKNCKISHVDIYNSEILMFFSDGHSVNIQVTTLSDSSDQWREALDV
jgi:hypothetical protein